jgi:hypothetical protein
MSDPDTDTNGRVDEFYYGKKNLTELSHQDIEQMENKYGSEAIQQAFYDLVDARDKIVNNITQRKHWADKLDNPSILTKIRFRLSHGFWPADAHQVSQRLEQLANKRRESLRQIDGTLELLAEFDATPDRWPDWSVKPDTNGGQDDE